MMRVGVIALVVGTVSLGSPKKDPIARIAGARKHLCILTEGHALKCDFGPNVH